MEDGLDATLADASRQIQSLPRIERESCREAENSVHQRSGQQISFVNETRFPTRLTVWIDTLGREHFDFHLAVGNLEGLRSGDKMECLSGLDAEVQHDAECLCRYQIPDGCREMVGHYFISPRIDNKSVDHHE